VDQKLIVSLLGWAVDWSILLGKIMGLRLAGFQVRLFKDSALAGFEGGLDYFFCPGDEKEG
jgi:hypothetical protein